MKKTTQNSHNKISTTTDQLTKQKQIIPIQKSTKKLTQIPKHQTTIKTKPNPSPHQLKKTINPSKLTS